KNDRFQGHPRTHHVVTTVSIFNVFPCHIPSPFLTYDDSMPPAARTNPLSLGRIPSPLSLTPCPLSRFSPLHPPLISCLIPLSFRQSGNLWEVRRHESLPA